MPPPQTQTQTQNNNQSNAARDVDNDGYIHNLNKILATKYQVPEQRRVAVALVNRFLVELQAEADGAPPPPDDAPSDYDEGKIARASRTRKAEAAALFFSSPVFFNIDALPPWPLTRGGFKDKYQMQEKIAMFKRGGGAVGQAAWRAELEARTHGQEQEEDDDDHDDDHE